MRSASATGKWRARTRGVAARCCGRCCCRRRFTRRSTRPGTGRGGCQSHGTRSRRRYMNATGEQGGGLVSHDEIDVILAGRHHDPHAVLGAHPEPGGAVIRALRPLARSISVVGNDGTRYPMRHVHQGVVSAIVPADVAGDYQLAVIYEADGPELVGDAPYRHLPTLGDVDLHLIGEGRHEEVWRALGAQVRPDLGGTAFTVWAPNARGVRVIGDFNSWDGRAHPMRSLGSTGVWELFVPGVGEGTKYKFEISGSDGSWHRKADPMAMFADPPPPPPSVVQNSRYHLSDSTWMTTRAERDPLREPMSVYDVHLGSWRA